MRKVILAPHCDDAALSLGAALTDGFLGDEGQIVVVFSRSCYTKHMKGTAPLEETTKIRNQEEQAAAARIGCTVSFMGFDEPFARPGFARPADICDADRRPEDDPVYRDVRDAVMDLMSRETGLVIGPLGYGNHIDHRIITLCMREAARKACAAIPAFFEDLPYCPSRNIPKIQALLPTDTGWEPYVPYMLRRGSLERKLKLLKIYESQMEPDYVEAVQRHWKVDGSDVVWVPSRLVDDVSAR